MNSNVQMQRQQQYIRHHNLAVIVDALLQDVATTKPADPFAVMAEKVATVRAQKRGGQGGDVR